MTCAVSNAVDALKALDAAESNVRRMTPVASMAITVDHIDKARLHVRALLADIKRDERGLR